MRIEFRLLGDVEVLIDKRRVDLGHARQRSVLVALLADVNRPVPVDRLLDRVWADRPPYRARNALSAYVSRLRHVLDGAGDVRLAREPGGYLLAADPSSVDLLRFRDLVARARAAEDPSSAVALFDQALGLWRGDPFLTVEGAWFDTLRDALHGERLAVRMDRTDVALRTGRHGELVGSLTTAHRAHPFDERIAAQLMLAQYGSGRQAEALDTYRRTRGLLLEELGADPGPLLRQAHEHVLTGTAGTIDPVRARRPRVPAPHPPDAPDGTLPRRRSGFVGRDEDLERVRAAVARGPLVTLTGVGGVGKTRLAIEVAVREQPRWPDGVRFCELAPLSEGAAVSHTVAATLGVRQRHGLTIDQSVVEFLRTRELLLVVDNCEHVLDAAAALLDQVVQRCHGVGVLVTSREATGVEGERIVPVLPLPVDEAAVLFEDRARASRPAFRLDDEAPGAVAEICRRLDGLPLAIELAAARMRAMNALEMARRLDHDRLVRGSARGSTPRHQSLVAALDWSYRLLTDREKVFFARLSVFAGGFDVDAAHGVCAAPDDVEDDTLELLTGLVDKSLVTVRSSGGRSRYGVLETLRAYGRERLREDGTEDRVARRHAEYFAALAEQAARELHGPDERAWVERTLPDYDNLRAAFESAAAGRDGDLTLRLVSSTIELTHVRVGYEIADWALRALEFVELTHPLAVAAVGVAARGAWNRGDLDAARSIAARAGGRTPGRGCAHVAYPADVLVDIALTEGDPQAARGHYRAEASRARVEADPVRLVWTLHLVAVACTALQVPEQGRAAAEEAVTVAEATGNPTARAMARYALGLVLKKSEPDRALRLFDESADQAAAVRNFWWHNVARNEAAATHAVHGETRTAAVALLEVLDRWDRVSDRVQQWLSLRYVTRLLARLGVADLDAAQDAVVLHHALGAAGRPSPLRSARLAELVEALGPDRGAAAATDGAALGAAAAVTRARTALRRYS